MKPLLFIMGGAGNIFYQLNFLHKRYEEDFFISEIFYNQKLQSILGHTMKKPFLNLEKKKCNFFIFPIYLFIFLNDLILMKIIRKSLFTVFDTTNLKMEPVFKPKIFFGYFQSSKFKPFFCHFNSEIFLDKSFISKKDKLVLHIRGGDYLDAYNAKNIKTNMPLPSIDWYTKAIKAVLERDHSINEVKIITDDKKFAENFCKELFDSINLDYSVVSDSFDSDLSTLMSAKKIIIYNSTFALMAAESNKLLDLAVISQYLKNKSISAQLRNKSIFI